VGFCLPGQQDARKLLGPLLSGVSALTRPLGADLGCRTGGRGVAEADQRSTRERAPASATPSSPTTNFNSGPRWPPCDDAGMPARARGLAVTAEPRRATISYPAWPGYPARRQRACLRRPPARRDLRRFYIDRAARHLSKRTETSIPHRLPPAITVGRSAALAALTGGGGAAVHEGPPTRCRADGDVHGTYRARRRHAEGSRAPGLSAYRPAAHPLTVMPTCCRRRCPRSRSGGLYDDVDAADPAPVRMARAISRLRSGGVGGRS